MAEPPTADALIEAALLRINIARAASPRDGVATLVSELRNASLAQVKAGLCRVIFTAANNIQENLPAQLVECGAVEAVLDAIRTRPAHPATVAHAFSALGILAFTSDWCGNPLTWLRPWMKL